jgi:GntR family transcriptional regulator
MRDERTIAVQLRDEIGAMIETQGLKPGDRLPTEAELTRSFRISRPALREALKLLEQDGIIYVEHGKGRFVSAMAAMRVERPITVFESVTDMVRRFGYKPNNKVLSIGEKPADAEVAAALRLEPETRVIRVERLRMQGDQVIVYCLDYVPRAAVPGRLYDVDWTGSLVALLDGFGQRPRMSAATATSVFLPTEVAA